MKQFSLILVMLGLLITACNEQKPAENNTKPVAKNTKLQHPDWTKHANIYEVNIRQYTPEGTFKAFDNHLDRLNKMGVDILWLMPVYPIGEKNRKGGLGSYYSIKDYSAVNPEFGNMSDLKALIDHAHSLGMHVILDWVANHTAWDHPWINEHPEWYKVDSAGNIVSPFDWSDVAALNYDNPQLRKAMIGEMKYWLNNANIDGFRCDVAMMVPTDFWDSARAELDKIKPVFMLAEAEVPELNKKAFDMSYGWEMHHKIAQVAQGKEAASVLNEQVKKDLERFGSDTYLMQFTTNHDENSWNGTEYEKMGDGAEIMAVFTYVTPGMPLIYSGQEAANKKRLAFFEKNTLNWESIPLQSFYQNLIRLKNENKALWNGNFGGSYLALKNSMEDKVVTFLRQKENNKVIFIGNMSAEPVKVNVDINDASGEYVNWFTNEKVKLGKAMEFELKPRQYYVLVK